MCQLSRSKLSGVNDFDENLIANDVKCLFYPESSTFVLQCVFLLFLDIVDKIDIGR